MHILIFIPFLPLILSGRLVFQFGIDSNRNLLSKYSCVSITRIDGFEDPEAGSMSSAYYVCERNSTRISDKHIFALSKGDYKIHKVFVDTEIHISASMLVDDPDFKRQSLYWSQQENEAEEPGLFHNFPKLWDKNITGKGIVIVVVDDGVDINHVELKRNYIPRVSYNFVEKNNDPHNVTDSHGTRCIGLISSQAKNTKCGIGAAYQAQFGAIRLFSKKRKGIYDSEMAQAVAYKSQRVHVYSMSWSTVDDGKRVAKPLEITAGALKRATAHGRQGKGSIFVWATGNGGHHSDHCGYNGFIQTLEVLGVSSTTRRGEKTWYGEKCSAILASCISGFDGSEKNKIFSTLPNDKCGKSISGTSVCPPIFSAAIALLLQVKHDLTWRDIQDLIIRSSLQIDGEATGNSAGLRFSFNFGFGILQPDKLVELATSPSYRRLSPQKTCRTPTFQPNLECDGRCVIHSTIFTSGCLGQVSVLDIIEVVIITLSIDSSLRGSLKVTLTSPTGTSVPLLEPRRLDTSKEALKEWDIKVLSTYDERVSGEWKMDIDVPAGVKTKLISWGMTLHGRYETKNSNNKKKSQTVTCEESNDAQNTETQKLCRKSHSHANIGGRDVDGAAYERTVVEIIKEKPKTICQNYGLIFLPFAGWLPWLLGRFGAC
ncbi:Neuroendocrine convertase 1 [Thelohanellus kitauei]|uniref:Neuroendocrine convertase 1 n=1 Tax=Thelohanellus kitauei TaxID=669202 RepID=A0A0C2NIC0_THEKT|nr:Neuroendocrine convertase 1 [Thelohanellus kitauei]